MVSFSSPSTLCILVLTYSSTSSMSVMILRFKGSNLLQYFSSVFGVLAIASVVLSASSIMNMSGDDVELRLEQHDQSENCCKNT